MKVLEIHDQNVWDSFVQAHAKDSGFLQSWAWGEFQASVGRTLWRLGVFGQHDNALKGVALLTHHRMPFGFSYLYAPRGPIIAVHGVEDMRVLDALTEYIREAPFPTSHIFVRFDAPIPETVGACTSLRHLGFFHAPHQMQPKSTLILDLTKSEEQLLAEMHSKTRYNIKLAERKGVQVEFPISKFQFPNKSQISNPNFQSFWSLLQETAKRDGFRTHSREYYERLLKLQCPNSNDQTMTKLFFAEYQGKVLAAALVAFYNNWALYLHGASSSQHRDFMAPHLLHWRIMQEAKARGCTKYDLWGADIVKWPGVTRFKQGFSLQTPITSYCGAWDYPFQPTRYSWYTLLSHFRRRLSL